MLLKALILTSVASGTARATDRVATADTPITLHAAVWTKDDPGCVMYTDAHRVQTRCRLKRFPEGTKASWRKVESTQGAYNNVPGGRFEWANIDWTESPWRVGPLQVAADVEGVIRASIPRSAGTMRYRVEVHWPDGQRLMSPGLRAAKGGPLPQQDIRKITLRYDDSYLGYMSELAGLPYIFGSAAMGSAAHQAERKIGVDCADLMIYGLRRMGHAMRYRSSRTLGPVSRAVTGLVNGNRDGVYLAHDKPISVGPRGVRPGDWIIFDGHVGAFVDDRGIIGVLDDQDIMMHIAWRELAMEPLRDSGYGTVPFVVRRAKVLAGSDES